MIHITFLPESDGQDYSRAIEEYSAIWKKDGALLIKIFSGITGLSFREKSINAVIFEGVSGAYPLRLRASYKKDIKRATLIHELGHRLLISNGIHASKNKKYDLEIHKQLYLILYDVWTDLYTKEFADNQVKVESARQPLYREAWQWALAMDRFTRQKKFRQLKK